MLFLPTAVVAALLGAFLLVGSWEWARFANWQVRARCAYAAVFAALMFIAFFWAPRIVDAMLALAFAGWLVAAYGLATWPRPIAALAIPALGFAALFPGWLLLIYIHGAGPLGPALAFAGLALVAAADIGAFAVGRMIGRTKLAPRISPGKTWEGVAGGIGLAVAVAWFGSYVLDLQPLAFVTIAIVTVVASVIGDLTVSMLKRNVGAKDSGSLLPGHGGVMDRIDGLAAAVPFFALGLKLGGLIE